MNKTSSRRQNRGDEKNNSLSNLPKAKSHDRSKNRRQSSNHRAPKQESSNHQRSNISEENPSKKPSVKPVKEKVIEKVPSKPSYGDGDNLRNSGRIQKYVFHEDDSVTLKLLQYNLDIAESLLTLFDPRKAANKRSYYILSAKDVSTENIKDSEAFQLKVKKTDKDMVTELVLKSRNSTEKTLWMSEFGIKMNLAYDLLKSCIDEVENRRFCKGQKKRNEVNELKEVDIGTLLRALDNQKSQKLKLSNDKRWNVSRIEKLIQVLLSEIPFPLIPYNIQEILIKTNSKNPIKEHTKIIKRLPTDNMKMLEILIEHLENLTNYYTNQLNAGNNEMENIRKNICSRLTPLIIRQEVSRENENGENSDSNNATSIVDKFCNMFYRLMENTANTKKSK